MTAAAIHKALLKFANPEIAQHSQRFFKSGKGEYGEGDRFLGIRVPVLRAQVKIYRDTPLRSVLALLKSGWHEERLLAVLLLVDQYKRASDSDKERLFSAYLEHREYVNNWDIVDSSAHLIVGPHLEKGSRQLLFDLATADAVWDRRIAMMASYHYIRQNDYKDALRLARMLRDDEHDLIHKMVGWMLREIGNRDRAVEVAFLDEHYKKMPRTMLRYAIEKFSTPERMAYLNGTA